MMMVVIQRNIVDIHRQILLMPLMRNTSQMKVNLIFSVRHSAELLGDLSTLSSCGSESEGTFSGNDDVNC